MRQSRWLALIPCALVAFACESDDPTDPETTHTLTVTVTGDGTVTADPAGLSCTGASCQGTYGEGVEVVLTALAGAESRFVAWGGACSDAGPCTVTMDQSRSVAVTFEPRVEDNGLTREINALVPDTLIAAMEALGMPIHRGPTPPSVEGVYHFSPLDLLASNVPGDPAAARFADYYLRFSEQDNEALTLTTDYVHPPAQGHGLGSFIVGSDGTFSVFAVITLVTQGDSAQSLEVYSGRLTPEGIADSHIALFMLDNGGRSPPYIPNGTGRVAHDSDGFSPEIPALPGGGASVAGAGAVVGGRLLAGATQPPTPTPPVLPTQW